MPLKGLLVLLPPQDEVNYSTSGGVNIPEAQRGLFIHMMPRRDGIVLGGTSERDVGTTDVNEAEKQRIVDNHVHALRVAEGAGSAAGRWRRRHPGGDERAAAAGRAVSVRRRRHPGSGLAREMGLLGLTATGICAMVGAAVNVIPFMIQRHVPGIGANVLPAYLLAAVPAVLAGLAYAMLASAMPRAGGSYVFASRALSPYLGLRRVVLAVVLAVDRDGRGVVPDHAVPARHRAGAAVARRGGHARTRRRAAGHRARRAVGGDAASTCSASRPTSG